MNRPRTAPAPRPAIEAAPPDGVDLLRRLPRLERFIKWRGFPYYVILPNLAVFYLLIIAGFIGTPLGNRNILIVFIWILWWFLLISALVPFGGRIWCTLCPLPAFGEWAQRLRLVGVRLRPGEGRPRLLGLGRAWPRRFRNIWLQNIGFLGLAAISAFLVTRPLVSAVVLLGMVVLAAGLALIYRLRAFCAYLCPVSGFLGLYAMASSLAVRVRDATVCRDHRGKDCVTGCAEGYGCPWFQFVGNMRRNNFCGMCLECVKTCPKENVSLFLRPFASDIRIEGMDEAFKACIMLALAVVYSVTLQGPWGAVKDAANFTETGTLPAFLAYAAGIFALSLGVFPLLFAAGLAAGRRLAGRPDLALRPLFVRFSGMLVPFGLLAWIAFSLPLFLVNGSYVVSVISDPLGRGWDLLGTAGVPWTPVIPDLVPLLQAPVVLFGLYAGLKAGRRDAATVFASPRQGLLFLLPPGILLLAVVLGLLWLYMG